MVLKSAVTCNKLQTNVSVFLAILLPGRFFSRIRSNFPQFFFAQTVPLCTKYEKQLLEEFPLQNIYILWLVVVVLVGVGYKWFVQHFRYIGPKQSTDMKIFYRYTLSSFVANTSNARCLLLFRVTRSSLAVLWPDPLSRWPVNLMRNRSFPQHWSGSRFSGEKRKQASCLPRLSFFRWVGLTSSGAANSYSKPSSLRVLPLGWFSVGTLLTNIWTKRDQESPRDAQGFSPSRSKRGPNVKNFSATLKKNLRRF